MFGLFKTKEDVNYKELIQQGAVILDVRSEEEFNNGHVKGAINIPLDMLLPSLNKIGNKDTHIITCCMSGGRSSMAKSILHQVGYDNVHNGGGWQVLERKIQQ